MREGILCMSPMALGLLREDAVYGCAGFPPLELAHVAFFFLFFFFSALVLGCFFFFATISSPPRWIDTIIEK